MVLLAVLVCISSIMNQENGIAFGSPLLSELHGELHKCEEVGRLRWLMRPWRVDHEQQMRPGGRRHHSRTGRTRSSEARSSLLKPGAGAETVDDDVIFLSQTVRHCSSSGDEVVIISPTDFCVPKKELGAARAAEAAIGEEDVPDVPRPLTGKWPAAGLDTPKQPHAAWRLKRASCRLAPVRRAVAASETDTMQPVVVEADGLTVCQRLEAAANRHQLVRSRGGNYEVPCPRPGCPSRVREEHQRRARAWYELPRVAVPTHFIVADPDSSSGLDRGLPGLFCALCDACAAIQVGQRWTTLEPLLRAPDGRDGWRPVRTPSDRTALYLLSQYVYGERERSDAAGEPPIMPTPLEDSALLLWSRSEAVGFVTLKRRGQLIDGGPEAFAMDVVDMVAVRRACRRRGHVTRLLDMLLVDRPGTRLGLTKPSPAMWRLLLRYLTARPALRPRVWLVQWAGHEGFRTNVWQELLRRSRHDPESSSAVAASSDGE
ncbi:uncharacterized protein LOC119103299 isoform X2 [Pollicipes pollicipes]|nr:uncharacterized protein LOC119103299 isoform X2 [Pollicipes pollicipes]XP_037082665.1 uncharacterized protein LOC119103299 isoform X2 [Pollicipes pollicipes]